MSDRRRGGGGSPTFDISDDERTGPRQTGPSRSEAHHRPKSDHPPEYDQARHEYKKVEKELKRKTEQLADAQREQQRREKQSRGGGGSAGSIDEALVGELRESAEGGREQLARERQELQKVELAISEMRGRFAHFARENAEYERERRRQHEQAVEEQMVEQRRLRAKLRDGGSTGVGGGGGGGRPLALPAPVAVATTTATASGPPAVDASGWLALVINLERRADRLAAVRALDWGGVRLERLPGVEGSGLEWDGLVSAGHVHAQAAEQARWAASREVPTICRESGSFSPHLTLGAVGCALAHRGAWERLAGSSAHDWALIAEDDLNAVAQPFASRLQRVLAALPPTWQICYLGYHETGGEVPAAADWAGGVVVAEVHEEEALTGLFGYMLRKACARHLLGTSGEVFPLRHQVDVALSRRAWPPGSRFAVPAARPLLGAPRSEEAACDTDVQTLGAPGKLAHDALLEGMLTL